MTTDPTLQTQPAIRLGDKLVELGLVSQDQLRIALQEQKNTEKPLGEIFLLLGFVTEEAMRAALADNRGEESISLKASLVLVALGEAALIYLSDFSGYMFDVVILTMALVMTVYCFVRAIRNYSDDVKKLGL